MFYQPYSNCSQTKLPNPSLENSTQKYLIILKNVKHRSIRIKTKYPLTPETLNETSGQNPWGLQKLKKEEEKLEQVQSHRDKK